MQKPITFILKMTVLFISFILISFQTQAQTKTISKEKRVEKKIISKKSKSIQEAPAQKKSTRKIKTSKADKPAKAFDKQTPKGEAVSKVKNEIRQAQAAIEKDKREGKISEKEYQKKKEELSMLRQKANF